MHTYRIVSPIIVAAAGGLGVLAQAPAVEVGGDYAKYGVIGTLALVLVLLITVLIPKLIESHEKSMANLTTETKTGLADVKDSVEAGASRNADLLQSTIKQLMEERRENRNK